MQMCGGSSRGEMYLLHISVQWFRYYLRFLLRCAFLHAVNLIKDNKIDAMSTEQNANGHHITASKCLFGVEWYYIKRGEWEGEWEIIEANIS